MDDYRKYVIHININIIGEKMVKPRKRWITDRWPNRLNLKIYRQSHPKHNPYGENYDYVKEVSNLDLDGVIRDVPECYPPLLGKKYDQQIYRYTTRRLNRGYKEN